MITVNFQGNRAHGLDAPRGEHWADAAACNRFNGDVDPEWWWPVEHGAPSSATRRAVHICRWHCPVRAQCDRDARDSPPQHPVVVGGRRFVAHGGGGRGRPRPAELVEADTCTGCPYCRETDVNSSGGGADSTGAVGPVRMVKA